MRAGRVPKGRLDLQIKDIGYLAAVMVIIVVTVLLFINRTLFSKVLPLVFLAGIDMVWYWKEKLKIKKMSENQKMIISVFYCLAFLILALFFFISCLTNW